jgi:hypothetical protein
MSRLVISSHDDDGVLGCHPAFVVGEGGRRQHLQQDVEHVEVHFLDFKLTTPPVGCDARGIMFAMIITSAGAPVSAKCVFPGTRSCRAWRFSSLNKYSAKVYAARF